MGKFNEEISKQFEEHIQTVKQNQHLMEKTEEATNVIIEAMKQGRKVLICGNGGSAADAQHIAAELVGKYECKSKAYPAIALTTDTSMITAWSNDNSFENLFSRQVEALGKKGDVLVSLTTSGNSPNVLKALEAAKKQELKTITFLGKDGGKAKGLSDVEILVKSNRTCRIQETHLLCYHIICGLVEQEFK